jgi:hypothetical protein
MGSRLLRWRPRSGLGRTLSGGLAAIAVLPLALVLARADGLPATRPELSGGSAWLASPAQGAVTLIDGASEQVVGAVKAPGLRAGQDLSAVQAGESAYLVSSAAGTVSRVDGATYDVSPAVQFGEPGGASLAVYAGRSATYVVDGQRRTASVLDPVTLRVRRKLALAGQPGPGQSVVDDAGRLWVVDANGLSWFDDAGKHERPDAGGAGTRLVLVAGRPWLVDLSRARAGVLSDGGTVRTWSCLDLRGGEQVELLGSATLGRVLAAIPATGMLIAAGDGGDSCGRTVAVGKPGDDFGPMVESGGFLFVPDRTSGRTAVVNLSTQEVIADLDVLKAGARLELVAKDGLVFYNNLDGDEAGVIRFSGGRWRLGRSLKKYAPGPGGAKILAPGGDRHPNQPAQQPNRPNRPGQQPGQQGQQPNQPGQQKPADNPPPDSGQQNPPPPDQGQQKPSPPPKSGGPTDPTGPAGPGTANLTVQVSGGGSVTAFRPAPLNSAAAGTVCTAICTWQYPAGTTAVLQLPNAPTPDVLLDTVDGCTSKQVSADTTTCSVLVSGAAKVVAAFVPKPPVKVTLTVDRTGAGAVSLQPAGSAAQTCPPACSVTVVAGTIVHLAATPDGGSYLNGFTGGGCPATGAACDVTAAQDTDVSVAFAPFLHLTAQTSGTAGTVTCSDGACNRDFRSGDTVTVTATPGAQSAFSHWVGCSSGSASCTLTMTADTTVTAAFVTTVPTVTVRANGREANLDTGTSLSMSSGTIDIFVNVDTGSTIRSIKLEDNFSDTCTDGHIAERDPARFDLAAQLNTGFPRLGYTFDPQAVACSGSLPTLESGGFVFTATVVTDAGTFTTKGFVVNYNQ